MSREFLAVDAGNSKTVAVVCTATGEITGRGRADAGDIYAAAGAAAAVGQVSTAVHAALTDAGTTVAGIDHAAFRLAGIDWADDDAFWDAAVKTSFPDLRSWSVKNDGFALVRLASLTGAGVSVIAGTGAAIAARGPGGSEFSVSWWVQDGIGGVSLGDAAFRTVVRANLGIDPPTCLTPRLLEVFGCRDVASLLELFTRRVDALPGPEKRRAARAVLGAADEGDPTAVRIVADQARSCAEYAAAAAHRTGFDLAADRVPVALGGSLMTSEHAVLRTATTRELVQLMGRVDVEGTTAPPVVGAALDALAEGGADPTEQVRTALIDAVHPGGFLQT